MKLTNVQITNFRCFESLSISLQEDVNIFVGINGAGKTTILDAIAIALYEIVNANGGGGTRQRNEQGVGLRPTDIHVKPEHSEIIVARSESVLISAQANKFYAVGDVTSTTDIGKERFIEWTDYVIYHPPNDFTYGTRKSNYLTDIYHYIDLLWDEIRRSGPEALIPLPVVAYYRSNRRLAQMPTMGDIFSLRFERDAAYQNAMNAGANYQAMCQWLYLRENHELRRRLSDRSENKYESADLRAVRSAIGQAIENVENVFFDDSPPRLKVELISKDSEKNMILDLEQLSDGYRNLIAIIMDFARRLALAHPNWDSPLTAPGILLIDEIELHLHPGWQQIVVPRLRKIFPNTQLIASTHSPQVLTTVNRENIVILRDNSAFSVPTHTYGAESNRVLTEVMSTESRPPENMFADRIRELFTLISQDQLDHASILCEELLSLYHDEPALLEAQTIIKNRMWEKELGLQ